MNRADPTDQIASDQSDLSDMSDKKKEPGFSPVYSFFLDPAPAPDTIAFAMQTKTISFLALLISAATLCGCVDRKLTVNTVPPAAMVELNDEQIGRSPVTVSFNWYGDYNVRISMDGYETLNTHRSLKAPWYDRFPFDFFAQVLWPGRIVDSYNWDFELAEKTYPQRDQLIDRAVELKSGL